MTLASILMRDFEETQQFTDIYESMKTEQMGERIDPFLDDTPIEVSCDLENPDSCESCQ